MSNAAMATDAPLAAVGMDHMSKMPIAQRVNFELLRSIPIGKEVCVGGHFKEASFSEKLVTTDGGSLTVIAEPTVAKELNDASLKGFVEVVGVKESDLVLRVSTVLFLGDKVDAGLWDEAIRMSHLPQLRAFFEPRATANSQ